MTCSAPATPPALDVRFHAGEMSWPTDGYRSWRIEAAAELAGGHRFAGEVVGRRASYVARFGAAVIELPLGLLPTRQSLGVWAEARQPDGSRVRIGNPFVASLLAGQRDLSRAYHAASPAQDSALLTAPLARRIAAIAAARGHVADPASHASRLAAELLPDVIRFRQDLPVGFSFAARNGRHPADDVASVVATVTAGAIASRAGAVHFPLRQSFPYFQTPGADA